MTRTPGTPVRPAQPESTQASVGRRWIVAYVLAMVGVAAGWFGPIQILLPAQAETFAGSLSKEAVLAIVTGYGAAASMVANPLWGVISDRSTARLGRRRAVLLAGTVVGVIGLVILAFAPTVTWMITGWVTVQIGLNGPLAALAAMIADHVPERQRGLVGSLFGIAQTVGVVVGTAVAVLAGNGLIGYLALAVATPALILALLILHRESPQPRTTVDRTALRAGAAVRLFLGELRPDRRFAWVWLIRFLLNLVNALVLLYLYFFLDDGVGVEDPAIWVLVLTVLNVAVTVLVAGVAGPLSDRRRRRRRFVGVGAGLLSAAALVMAFAPALPTVVAATVLLGVGWGAYIAVDMAIVTEVLPHESTRATALGLVNIASALPQVLAPVLAAPIVTLLGGYQSLYLVAAALAALALLATTRLRTIP